MTKIGAYNNRTVLYTNIRANPRWFEELPASNWLAFTIANADDRSLLLEVTIKCLDQHVLYTCSVGDLASETESYFDEEIAFRQVQIEEATGDKPDTERTPITISGSNFDEMFWFSIQSARASAHDQYVPIDKVVCIDMTHRGVKKYLIKLLDKIENGWLPSDNEIEIPEPDA